MRRSRLPRLLRATAALCLLVASSMGGLGAAPRRALAEGDLSGVFGKEWRGTITATIDGAFQTARQDVPFAGGQTVQGTSQWRIRLTADAPEHVAQYEVSLSSRIEGIAAEGGKPCADRTVETGAAAGTLASLRPYADPDVRITFDPDGRTYHVSGGWVRVPVRVSQVRECWRDPPKIEQFTYDATVINSSVHHVTRAVEADPTRLKGTATLDGAYAQYPGVAAYPIVVTWDLARVERPAVIAVDDRVTTWTDAPVVIAPLRNDQHPAGAALSLAGFPAQPQHGTVVPLPPPESAPAEFAPSTASSAPATATPPAMATTPATHVLYSPEPGFSGADTFTYTASDGQRTATATVTVTVAPPAPGIPRLYLVDGMSGGDRPGGSCDGGPVRGDPAECTGAGAALATYLASHGYAPDEVRPTAPVYNDPPILAASNDEVARLAGPAFDPPRRDPVSTTPPTAPTALAEVGDGLADQSAGAIVAEFTRWLGSDAAATATRRAHDWIWRDLAAHPLAPQQALILLGHSGGGAVAANVAGMLKDRTVLRSDGSQERLRILGVVTLGAPVANWPLAVASAEKVVAVQEIHDALTLAEDALALPDGVVSELTDSGEASPSFLQAHGSYLYSPDVLNILRRDFPAIALTPLAP